MIRSLRRKHRLLWLLWAILLPTVLVLGLWARRPSAQMASLPEGITDRIEAGGPILFEQEKPWQGDYAIRIRVFAGETPLSPLSLELTPAVPIPKPDILVYWSATQPEKNQAPPEDAHLLGVLGGTAAQVFFLPQKGGRTAGHLLLFSLAHQEMIAITSLPEINGSPEGSP